MRTIRTIKTKKMLHIEKTFDRPIEELLRHLYIEKDMTIQEIHRYFLERNAQVSVGRICEWLHRLGIPTRGWGLPHELHHYPDQKQLQEALRKMIPPSKRKIFTGKKGK